MRTVGQLLKEERLKKGFSLEQIETATKIRAKFLTALENDDYFKLPAVPYIQGFVKNYSDFLGLRSSTILALFRRQFIQKKSEQKNMDAPLTETEWQLTPNKVIVFLVFILVGSLFFYFYSQYRQLHTPPPLVVESPPDDLVTEKAEISVYGKTDKDATLTINNEPVLVKEDGKFFKDFPVTVGNNTLVIEATTRVGKKTAVTRRITRTPD